MNVKKLRRSQTIKKKYQPSGSREKDCKDCGGVGTRRTGQSFCSVCGGGRIKPTKFKCDKCGAVPEIALKSTAASACMSPICMKNPKARKPQSKSRSTGQTRFRRKSRTHHK